MTTDNQTHDFQHPCTTTNPCTCSHRDTPSSASMDNCSNRTVLGAPDLISHTHACMCSRSHMHGFIMPVCLPYVDQALLLLQVVSLRFQCLWQAAHYLCWYSSHSLGPTGPQLLLHLCASDCSCVFSASKICCWRAAISACCACSCLMPSKCAARACTKSLVSSPFALCFRAR